MVRAPNLNLYDYFGLHLLMVMEQDKLRSVTL
jgi:hypothetical protein